MPLALVANSSQLGSLKRPREQLCSGQPGEHDSSQLPPALPTQLDILSVHTGQPSTVPLHQRDSNLPEQPRIKRRLVSGNLRRAEQAGSAAPAATCRQASFCCGVEGLGLAGQLLNTFRLVPGSGHHWCLPDLQLSQGLLQQQSSTVRAHLRSTGQQPQRQVDCLVTVGLQ